MPDWSHIDASDEANMVDVGDKPATRRRAVAVGFLYISEETVEALREGRAEKGEVTQVSRIAGIMGAKKTPELIPMCHQLDLEDVDVGIELNGDASALRVRAEVACTAKTGAEMEALTAVSTACLTLYDMCKSIDKSMHIGDIHLRKKTGGQSGDFEHPNPPGTSGGEA
jgi:cyclic pyranopterin phosphate synthase